MAEEFLNAKIQEGHHSSIIDARTALALYRLHYEEIETKFRCREALLELQQKRQRAFLNTEEQDSQVDKDDPESAGTDINLILKKFKDYEKMPAAQNDS